MKSFACILILALIAVAQSLTTEQKASIQSATKECKAKTGVSQESLDKAYRGEAVDDPKLREQGLCFAQKLGIVDDQGHISSGLRTSLNNIFPNDPEVDTILSRCAVNKPTAMETANHYLHCLHKIKSNFHS